MRENRGIDNGVCGVHVSGQDSQKSVGATVIHRWHRTGDATGVEDLFFCHTCR
jgi:hypothetical protein